MIDGKKIPFSRTADASRLKLNDVDVMLECTGKAISRDIATTGLRAGAKRVLISGPSDAADLTVVLGANDHLLDEQLVVSNASCTTNALAPLIKRLDEVWGLQTQDYQWCQQRHRHNVC